MKPPLPLKFIQPTWLGRLLILAVSCALAFALTVDDWVHPAFTGDWRHYVLSVTLLHAALELVSAAVLGAFDAKPGRLFEVDQARTKEALERYEEDARHDAWMRRIEELREKQKRADGHSDG